MRNFIAAFIILVVVILVYIMFFDGKSAAPAQNSQNTGSPAIALQNGRTALWETKSDDQADIIVEVTPLDLAKDSRFWKFEISLNTHAGDLDQDLTQIAELMDEQEKTIKPLSWEGDPPGGHHRTGVLTFSAISLAPQRIELKLKNIGVPERSFRWENE